MPIENESGDLADSTSTRVQTFEVEIVGHYFSHRTKGLSFRYELQYVASKLSLCVQQKLL